MAYSSFQLARKYIQYYFNASNGQGHGIHSPFVYDFVRQVLLDRTQYPDYRKIEALRAELLKDNTMIEVADFGAGSARQATHNRRVNEITRHSVKQKKFSQLLFRMARYYSPTTILELGTSVGITTAYLAAACPEARLISLEGAPAVANLARQNFEKTECGNIELRVGNFDQTLQSALASLNPVEFSFVDGNHRSEPTLDYFEKILSKRSPSSVIIFDDIHWSVDMEKAWEAIQNHPGVMVTIDLFFMGLVFFREEFRIRQHFRIRF